MQDTRPPQQPAVSRRTLRLRFEYEGENVRLVFARRVDMITPPATEHPLDESHSGSWFELRDAHGKVLYQRAMHSPIHVDHEVFSEDPKKSIARVPAEEPKGVFEILVPDTPEGATVRVLSSAAGTRRYAKAAEMISVDIRNLQKEGQ